MSQQDFELLRTFLEEREVSIRAAKPLKAHTIIGMVIVGDPESYYVSREGKKTHLNKGLPPDDPHLTFTVSPAAIKRLSDFQSDSIGEFGVEFFKIMISMDPETVLDVKLNTGFIGLTRLGFFGILAAGGSAVMGFLARQGLRSIREIRKAIAKAQGREE